MFVNDLWVEMVKWRLRCDVFVEIKNKKWVFIRWGFCKLCGFDKVGWCIKIVVV